MSGSQSANVIQPLPIDFPTTSKNIIYLDISYNIFIFVETKKIQMLWKE